ncbi:hypothetical protein D3C87_757810 [compost metagenome]
MPNLPGGVSTFEHFVMLLPSAGQRGAGMRNAILIEDLRTRIATALRPTLHM